MLDRETCCFWCDLERFTRSETELPESYAPCDTCRAQHASGLCFVEVHLESKTISPLRLADDRIVYPTGRWLVVNPDAAVEAVNRIQGMLGARSGYAFLTPDVWEKLNFDTLRAS